TCALPIWKLVLLHEMVGIVRLDSRPHRLLGLLVVLLHLLLVLRAGVPEDIIDQPVDRLDHFVIVVGVGYALGNVLLDAATEVVIELPLLFLTPLLGRQFLQLAEKVLLLLQLLLDLLVLLIGD